MLVKTNPARAARVTARPDAGPAVSRAGWRCRRCIKSDQPAALAGHLAAIRRRPGVGSSGSGLFSRACRGDRAESRGFGCAPRAALRDSAAELDPIEARGVVAGTSRIGIASRFTVPSGAGRAVQLTKQFGATDGHKFVNAVLDRAAKELRRTSTAGRRSKAQ